MTQRIIHQHIEASRSAGTLAAVEHIADELAAHLDPKNPDRIADRVRSILFRDRDESNEIARRHNSLRFEVLAERLDERTTEALDALAQVEEVA